MSITISQSRRYPSLLPLAILPPSPTATTSLTADIESRGRRVNRGPLGTIIMDRYDFQCMGGGEIEEVQEMQDDHPSVTQPLAVVV